MDKQDRLFGLALSRLDVGNHAGAMDPLREILGEDPDHADAHALLSICLCHQKRIHAARYEAGAALAAEANNTLAHYAMTLSLMGLGENREAEEHLDVLMELDPENADYFLLKAKLYDRTGREKEVLGVLLRALELEPENPAIKTAIGEERLERGKIEDAEAIALEVLEEYPEHQDALTLMGSVCLRKGDVEGARQHAAWALRQDPTNHDTLYLLSAIKARKSRVLGLWWRYHTWISELGNSRAILVLLGAFILYRVTDIHLDQNDQEQLAGVISMLWFAVCVYTWVGPELFRKSVIKETESVTLDENF